VSFSQYERGEFIRSKIQYYILLALGREEIDAIEASRLFDLISEVETSGSTHNSELVREPFYLQAVKDWKKVRERRVKKYEDRTIVN